jgi:hypothetical protein
MGQAHLMRAYTHARGQMRPEITLPITMHGHSLPKIKLILMPSIAQPKTHAYTCYIKHIFYPFSL